MSKLLSLTEAVSLIKDGDMLGIGGNVLHRAPMAIIREILRQKKKNLRVVKTAGAMDVDLLCFGEAVSTVDAGFISYESEFSLANHYRTAVQTGKIKANEHACYTVISALRAAGYGVSFMPVKGLVNSDLIEVNDYFKVIQDPFTGEDITIVKSLNPDYSILHVQEADEKGNFKIAGPIYDDVTLAKASKNVIISAERIVPTSKFTFNSVKSDIPGFMVKAVIKLPKGAKPCSCSSFYDIDRKHLEKFKSLRTEEELLSYLNETEILDRQGGFSNGRFQNL